MLRACLHETEVREALALGHWPRSCSSELRAHVAECRACGDRVLLAQAFQTARVESVSAASLPAAGVLWWRAQLRRRNAAVARIQRPLVGAQMFALALALVVMTGTLTYAATHGPHWFSGITSWMSGLWPAVASQGSASLIYLVPAVAMLLLLGCVALYLATEKQ